MKMGGDYKERLEDNNNSRRETCPLRGQTADESDTGVRRRQTHNIERNEKE